MGAITSLSTSELSVGLGADVSVDLSVRNTGSVVDEFSFEFLGPAAEYGRCEPDRLSLFPAGAETTKVTFAIPSNAPLVAGRLDFAVKVNSREDQDGSSVAEGVLDILPRRDFTIELIPRTSAGRRAGRHTLLVENRSNTEATVKLGATEPDDQLRFGVRPASLTLAAGAAATSDIVVRPRASFWKGPERTTAYTVHAEADDGQRRLTEGVFRQQAMLPRWTWRLGATVLAGLLGLLLFWAVAVKPIVRSSAREAARREAVQVAAPVMEQASETKKQAEKIDADLQATKREVGARGTGEAPPAVPPQDIALNPISISAGGGRGAPWDARIDITTPANQTFTRWLAIPEPGVLITDLIVENPGADPGVVRVKRNDALLFRKTLGETRDRVYNFSTGAPFAKDDRLIVEIDCRRADGPCNDAVYVSGELQAITPRTPVAINDGPAPPVVETAVAVTGPEALQALDAISAAPFTEAPIAVKPEEVNGHWIGDWGRLMLRAQGEGTVRGTYSHDEGTVQGRIEEDNVFRGWWCEKPSRAGGIDAGPVEFRWTRNEEGALRLDGRWMNARDLATPAEPGWDEGWDVNQVTDEPDPALVSRFDDAAAFCSVPVDLTIPTTTTAPATTSAPVTAAGSSPSLVVPSTPAIQTISMNGKRASYGAHELTFKEATVKERSLTISADLTNQHPVDVVTWTAWGFRVIESNNQRANLDMKGFVDVERAQTIPVTFTSTLPEGFDLAKARLIIGNTDDNQTVVPLGPAGSATSTAVRSGWAKGSIVTKSVKLEVVDSVFHASTDKGDKSVGVAMLRIRSTALIDGPASDAKHLAIDSGLGTPQLSQGEMVWGLDRKGTIKTGWLRFRVERLSGPLVLTYENETDKGSVTLTVPEA